MGTQRGAFVTVLDPHVSTRGEMGHIVITVLGMVAQMERRFIKERQKDGIEKAKAGGVYRGGRPRLDRQEIKKLATAGHTPSAIAQEVRCSRMQVYRILARSGPINLLEANRLTPPATQTHDVQHSFKKALSCDE